MGYPAFNLTTIQLPAPTSNLTRAEYKSVYGIDLNAVNIKSFKVVIFGNDKYAIDQIKEIEGGYEVYFNGRILSITDTIETSNEVYDVANAKPIYCHPISIDDDTSANKVHLAMLIFDNSPQEYNTLDKLVAKLQSIFELNANAVFPITGAIYYDSASLLHIGQKIAYLAGSGIVINTARPDGTQGTFTLSTYLGASTIYDGVNKIN